MARMTGLRDDALRLATLRALQEAIAQEVADLTATVDAELRELGARTLDVKLPDGKTNVAVMSTVTGKSKPYIADEVAFIDWVLGHRPDEVQVIRRVNPAYQAALLGSLVEAEGEGFADTSTGEFVPGVASKTTASYTRVVSTDEQRDALAAAWAAGELSEVMGDWQPRRIER